jgi:hypothetical protein
MGFTSSRLHLITFDSDKHLLFPLLIESDDCDEKMTYTPRSDFSVSIRDFPHLVLEVNSQKANRSDENRMLLQAACFSRISNWLRGPTHDKPIVIMAIYIDKDFNACQHILYQPNVESIEVVFNWF